LAPVLFLALPPVLSPLLRWVLAGHLQQSSDKNITGDDAPTSASRRARRGILEVTDFSAPPPPLIAMPQPAPAPSPTACARSNRSPTMLRRQTDPRRPSMSHDQRESIAIELRRVILTKSNLAALPQAERSLRSLLRSSVHGPDPDPASGSSWESLARGGADDTRASKA